MKSIKETNPELSPNNDHEQSTISTEEDKPSPSTIALITSPDLTIEMAVNYLYKWRKSPKITAMLLERIKEFCFEQSIQFIPTIMYRII